MTRLGGAGALFLVVACGFVAMEVTYPTLTATHKDASTTQSPRYPLPYRRRYHSDTSAAAVAVRRQLARDAEVLRQSSQQYRRKAVMQEARKQARPVPSTSPMAPSAEPSLDPSVTPTFEPSFEPTFEPDSSLDPSMSLDPTFSFDPLASPSDDDLFPSDPSESPGETDDPFASLDPTASDDPEPSDGPCLMASLTDIDLLAPREEFERLSLTYKAEGPDLESECDWTQTTSNNVLALSAANTFTNPDLWFLTAVTAESGSIFATYLAYSKRVNIDLFNQSLVPYVKDGTDTGMLAALRENGETMTSIDLEQWPYVVVPDGDGDEGRALTFGETTLIVGAGALLAGLALFIASEATGQSAASETT
mmetsp:Transcript_1804/g.4277  ORF Transcript_1804/g.4277 Transcript_1804/m.4277 type:complete len:365 (+) Transcript_1804:728-1822(+)|eukprot:CAMPEP_0198368594 /NCGR_PEP_ID=MMETSP1450-20131203/155780_1 /TAXON_ID=753684 ORGANISM="Madagascaria erythrocladiodes, Strain CCMP3234" /NCGR_SAMPLE_ID=MMETSP1450 /ASSEMBLY_ACC=CAM_ASM_001115 /LENGTH=364 /DNA_ID=CAMNT_0044076103 /DNA_START=722 /DNA_END=1816 /DNA_ORIENTATION=+